MRCKGKLLKSPFKSWLVWSAVAAWMLIANPTAMAADKSGPVVPTFGGVFRGVSTPTMNEFLGIRYAQAPVGDLRWRPPRAPERVPGIQDATQFANHCPQAPTPFGVPSVTEDCLFLNVYTPTDGKRSLYPVMFWIHGGALVTGESDDYNPERLVQQGVVVVTVNYRLGALGFLAHPALGAEDGGPSGNYGIMDQQLAMKWVRRNIAFFGGDPLNITIFGESAGGLSTFSNLVSPLAGGLFHRAIVESGAYSLTLPSLATAEAEGEVYAAAEGCTSQTADCLRALTVEQVLADQIISPAGYVTNVDGKVLPLSIDAALETGQFNRVPIVNGTNHDEWRLFVAEGVLAGVTPTPDNYPGSIATTLGIPVAATGPIVALYPPGTTTLSTELALGQLGTDAIFACPAHFASSVASQFVPTFAYEFNDENAPEDFLPLVGFPYGAAHASELQYLFDLRIAPTPLDASQQQLSATMVDYWTEFARRGDPSQQTTPTWPAFSPAVDDVQSLVPPTPATELNFFTAHNCAFWDAFGRMLP